MSDKRKVSTHEPYGLLGKAFHYTRDDLNANRAGYMSLAQQLAFKFWERKIYTRWLTLPPLKWILGNKRHEAVKITGKVKKDYTIRIISSGDRGAGQQQTLETRTIQFLARHETVTFYVNETQYNALPEDIEMTLYYDKMNYRIVSVEPPYAEK